MKYTIDEAREIYFRENHSARLMVERIASWDRCRTLAELAKELCMKKEAVEYTAKFYGLEYKHLKVGRKKIFLTPREETVVKLKECGMSYDDIGKYLNVSRQRVQQLLNQARRHGRPL